MTPEADFDRSAQDIGNIVFLEHVNVKVPDQTIATAFYIAGLGLTRDPYLMVGLENMWINIGQQQFHLPTGAPQVFPGPHRPRGARPRRAARRGWRRSRSGSPAPQFACSDGGQARPRRPARGAISSAATPPRPEFGDLTLGMAEVAVPVRPGAAAGIARFYEKVMARPPRSPATAAAPAARVQVGQLRQELVFRETPEDDPAVRRPPHRGVHHGLLGAAPPPQGARARQRGVQRVPVPLQGHRGPGHGRAPAARSSTRCAASPTRCTPPAREPQSRPAPAHLCRAAATPSSPG